MIVCEDNRIEKVISGLDRGAGVRLIVGQRTAYAYTNEVTTGSLMEMADAVRQAAAGDPARGPLNLSRKNRVDLPVGKARSRWRRFARPPWCSRRIPRPFL
jgi:TldD protein